MIVKDAATVQKYLTVNSSVTYETLEPYIRQAERKNIKPLIGAEQYAIFETTPETTEKEITAAWELCQEAICYFAMYKALPALAVQVTEGGIFAATSSEAQQATDKQFKELLRSQKTQANETLDEMLKVMEAFTSKFPKWTEDASYKKYTSLLVNSTSIFNEYYNIFDSRLTFMAMKPEISIVENQFIEAPIQTDLLEALKTKQTVDERIKVKELLQQAIVCFTISKVVENGLFVLNAEGIHVRFDVLPYEKVNSNVNIKINDFLVRTKINKVAEGEQFLKKALAIITENLDKFEEYTEPEETTAKSTVHTTKGITLC